MAEPGFYPGPPGGVEVHETHISWVFLTDDRAFKLRKAVVFPFLDYGTAERRRHMCEEEVRLGRRLAPELYLGRARGRRRAASGFALAEADAGDACEHVVEMRRFDEATTLAARLEPRRCGEADGAPSPAGSRPSTPLRIRRRRAASAPRRSPQP